MRRLSHDDERNRGAEHGSRVFGTVDDTAPADPPFRCDYGYNVHVGEDFYANTTAWSSTPHRPGSGATA